MTPLPPEVRNRLRHVLLTLDPQCPVDDQINAVLLALDDAGLVVVKRYQVETIAAWFDDYEMQHRAKGTEDGERKARINSDRAKMVRSLIAASEEKP